jgi:hypothetical protein
LCHGLFLAPPLYALCSNPRQPASAPGCPRVLTGQPLDSPTRTVFSVVVGSHTHYLAAETLGEARQWVTALRETWLHCFAHAARASGGGALSGSAALGQRLAAENAALRESLKGLSARQSAEDGEYWRCAPGVTVEKVRAGQASQLSGLSVNLNDVHPHDQRALATAPAPRQKRRAPLPTSNPP